MRYEPAISIFEHSETIHITDCVVAVEGSFNNVGGK